MFLIRFGFNGIYKSIKIGTTSFSYCINVQKPHIPRTFCQYRV